MMCVPGKACASRTLAASEPWRPNPQTLDRRPYRRPAITCPRKFAAPSGFLSCYGDPRKVPPSMSRVTEVVR